MSDENELKGMFLSSLKRNNKQIRDDRALAIAEGTELLYKREIEDLQTELKMITRDQDAALDLGGTNTTSIIAVSDFDTKAFVKKDILTGVKIREIEIMLEIAQRRYSKLFKEEV